MLVLYYLYHALLKSSNPEHDLLQALLNVIKHQGRVLVIVKTSPSATVIRDNSDDLVARIKLHELTALRAILIHVEKNNTGKPPHHIDQLKLEIRICIKTALEIHPECRFAFDHA